MDKEVSLTSGPADYITLSDVARSYITANTEAFENGIYRPQAGKIRRFAAGFADSMLETRKLKDSLMIFGGQGAMTVGGLFGEDSSITQWGKELVRTGSRQIAAIDAENAKMGMDIADYEKETFSYKLGGGFASVVQMLLAGYATGGVGSAAKLGAKAVSGLSKASAVTVAAGQEISSEVQEGLQVYRERTGDQDLKNYSAKEAGKEFFTTSGYAAAAGALESLNLTRVMPFLREGKKVIPNFAKGAFSEGVTESAQELANIGFDLVDGTIDFSKMPDRLYGLLEQGLIGGLVGGTTAGAFSVYNRAKIKNYLREEVVDIVPEKDLNDVVDALYDAGIDTMAGIVTTELSHSESLRNKHGDIYRSMMAAIDKALNQAGSVSESAVLAQTNEIVEALKDFSSIKEYPIIEFPVDQIESSLDVPNFKEGANESGIVEGEELGGAYERLGTPPIVIWERLGGRHEVITGRHRLDLARRTGESTIPVQIVKEADGFTAQDAQNFDVESNIKDEKGTTKDYVRYFERRPELSEEAARNGGLLARKGINAWKIARIGSDDVRSQFLSGKISERKAVAISEGAPGSDAAQAAGLSRAEKLSAEELKAFVSIINQAVPENATKAEQGDLFGFDDSYLKEQEKIASLVAKDKALIADKIRAVKGALRNPQAAEEMGLKFEATPENIAAEVEKLNMQSAALDSFYLNSDLMRYYRNKINGRDAGNLDGILNLSVIQKSVDGADPNQGALFQTGPDGLSALFTDESARAAYVSETAAMFADQVLAEANFRHVAIDDILKASDIIFEDGGIKFKTGTQTFDESGNVLEQAMFRSKVESIEEFYNTVISGKEKRSIYFQQQAGNVLFDIPADTVRHDFNKHFITASELSSVFNAMNAGKIKEAYYGDYQRYAGVPVKMSVDVNGTEYGVSFERLKNGRNILGTVFKLTDKTWLKRKNAQANPSHPDSKSRPLGHSLINIIKKIDTDDNNPFYQTADLRGENGVKGSYSPYNRLIKITENADYSTLPHEFAHFWLSEMESWVNSGLASDNYMNRYDIAMDWLKAEAGRPLSRRVQERFARGYEQYLLSGNLPGNPMNPVYAEYDKWLKAVYNDMNQPSKKPLTTDMVRFFQSMTTGTLPATVLPPVNIDREREKEKKEAVSKNGIIRSVETPSQRAGISSFEGKITPIPLAAEAKNGKVSAAAERQNRLNKISGLLKEDPQNVFYDPVTLEQSAKQAEMLIEQDGLDGVRQMIDGEKPMPENVIRTAVLIAYEQEMLKQGNTAEYLRVLRKHTLEQTRRGQEISAERINQDITNPSYWVKQALLGRKNALSNAIFERIKKEGDTKEKAVDRFVAQTASEYAEKLEKNTDKGAVIKDLNTKIKSISGKQIELFQKESVIGKTYDAVYDEIGRWIEECFDVGISVDEMNVLSEKTEGLVREFQAGLRPGENPSVEAMAKIKEMRETVAAMNPTNWLSLAVNSYGRAAMLSSPKSAILNILSNAETYATEAIVRRVVSGSYEKAVDPAVIKDYLKYDFDVYQKSGVMMSVVRPEEIIDPARRLLGENVMSSAGDGNFRKSVRFMERLVFNWGLGAPDAKAKALSFVDNAALEATKTAKAEGLSGQALTKRATELFKDACLYQPMTADGISIRNNSINAAEVATFTNNGKIAEMSSKVRNLINAATGKARLGDFVMPFVKTPANVVSLGMEYSFGLGTAALHIPQILADVRAGTLSDVSRNVIRSSIRNGVGIALAALIASLFDPDDYISSFALASQKERDLVRFKNGVYNSIKIGNKYVSLDYFGPLAAPLVGWFEAKKARGLVEKIASFVKAAGAQLSNVPGIKELSALTGWVDKAVSQPTEKTLEDLWNGTADQILARTVPAIISDVAKIVDPYERVSQDGIVGALASKIPGARQNLTAKADISTGREKRSENALSVLLFGARVKTAADNAMAREFKRLGDVGETPQLSDVARSFRGLTDKGKAQIRMEFVKGFVNQWGNKVDGYSNRVSRLIGSADYQAKTDAQKKEAINKIRKKMVKELKRKYSPIVKTVQ